MNGCFEDLADKNRRPPNHKNRGKEAAESTVVASAIKHPIHAQVRAAMSCKNVMGNFTPKCVTSYTLANASGLLVEQIINQ